MDKLKFNLLLTLEQMALRKVVILSWSVVDTCLVPTEDHPLNPEVEDKLSKLGLPRELMNEAIDLVGPIGYEINRWRIFHLQEYRFQIKKPLDFSTLCWTSVGQIDDKKTAEKVTRSNIRAEMRYKYACYYCLEDSLPVLLSNLSLKSEKHYFCTLTGMYNATNALMFIWPHILAGKHFMLNRLWKKRRSLTSFNQWAFEFSVEQNIKACAQYFFEKLTSAEREASLMRCANSLFYAFESNSSLFNSIELCYDISCYLLNLMTSSQQREMVEKYPTTIVLLFLFCPAQDLYTENATLVWSYFPPNKYYRLLKKMYLIFYKNPAIYFPRFFREFFILSPPELKNSFVNELGTFFPARDFLSFFFKYSHSESIKIIFKNIDRVDMLKLIFHRKMFNLFYNSVLDSKGSMVALCLQHATLLEEEKMRWKDNFIFYVFRIRHGKIEKKDPKWKWIFDL